MSSTDLVNFRDQFLAKAEARLNALDIAAASDETLLLNSALLKAYAAVNDFDVISANALSFLTNKTGAQLQTALQDPSNRAQFEEILASSTAMTAVAASSTAMTAVAASSTAMTAVAASSTAMTAVIASSTAMTAVIASSTAMTAVAASSTAMTAVAASSTAMTAVIASSTAMTAVAASSTAMTAVAASSTAMTAVAASSTAMTAVWANDSATDAVIASETARLAVYNSDTALAALQGNPTQVQRLITRGAASNVISVSFTNTPMVIVANGTKLILLRRHYTFPSQMDVLDWARGSITAAVGQGPAGGGRNLDTSVAAIGCVSGGYEPSGSPTSDTTISNFVSAANGLQIRTAPGTGSVGVKFIIV